MVGTTIWIVWLAIVSLRITDALLLLAPLVLHPLVLATVVDDTIEPGRWWRWARWAQLPGAACLVAAFEVPVGPLAGLLALPWVAATALTALVGVRRVWRRTWADLHEVGLDAALLFVLVGATWAAASRAGLRPLGFSDVIVLLTAEHFHYAGFVLPALATLVARELGPRRWWPLPVVLVSGVVLTAIGITLSPVLEVIAASCVVGGGIGVATGQLLTARRTTSGWASLLLALSGMSLLFAMALAMLYAIGEARGLPWPSIPNMIVLHGTANALGASLLGVWGWTVHAGVSRR
jgi:hypothetical protein